MAGPLQRAAASPRSRGSTSRSTRRSSASCSSAIPDFGRAYEPDGLTIDEFDGYGATVRTLRTFIGSYHDLVGAVRDIVLPNPDAKPV